jgi:hypothetical protein
MEAEAAADRQFVATTTVIAGLDPAIHPLRVTNVR